MNHLSLLVEQRNQALMQDAQHERLVRQIRAANRQSSTPSHRYDWAALGHRLQGILRRPNREVESAQPNVVSAAGLEIEAC